MPDTEAAAAAGATGEMDAETQIDQSEREEAPVVLGPSAFWSPARLVDSAWLGHIPFAFWLTAATRPRVLVELGAHAGASYCAFCQAIDALSIGTAAYAVDTWEGDKHAGFYDEAIFGELNQYNSRTYGGFSRLLRCSFDDALEYFSDGEIDLLHIDGLHTYDAVRHDFETWQPKLSNRSIVLFHDTNVRERDFGVWRFWAELVKVYPTFTFHHHHGLGLACVGERIPEGLQPLLAAAKDSRSTVAWRASFARLGQGVQAQWEAAQHQAMASQYQARLELTSRQKSDFLVQLERSEAEAHRLGGIVRQLSADLAAAHEQSARDRTRLDALRSETTSERVQLNQRLRRLAGGNEQLSRELAKHRRRRLKQKSSKIRLIARPVRAMFGLAKQPFKSKRRAKHERQQDPRRALLAQEAHRASLDRGGCPGSKDVASLMLDPSGPGGHSVAGIPGSQPSADELLILSSGLFDSAWYRSNCPSVAHGEFTAVQHFLDHGAAEGRDPHPAFSTHWYAKTYSTAAEVETNPLLHYLKYGWKIGLKPTEGFDPRWYLLTNPDVLASGQEPYAHFLGHGKAEGRQQNALVGAPHVSDARIVVVKSIVPTAEMVLFVTHAPLGRIKPHALIYLDALKLAGLSTIAIVATDDFRTSNVDELSKHADGVFVRENGGFDFAAWAHVARHLDFAGTKLLCLANDSLIGPFDLGAFQRIMARVRQSDAELVCLTDNYEYRHHFQSYFLAAKGEGVKMLKSFLCQVRSLEDKDDVIQWYELPLLDAFKATSLRGEALFPSQGRGNPTIENWRALIERGFPFIKAALLRKAEGKGWREVLLARGYDLGVAEETIELIGHGENYPSGNELADARREWDTARSALTSALQATVSQRDLAVSRTTELKRDLARARRRPWKLVRNKLKFDVYRRLARLIRPMSARLAAKYQRRASKCDPARSLTMLRSRFNQEATNIGGLPWRRCYGSRMQDELKSNVLIISHDATRSGAPILAQNLSRELSPRYNVTTLCLADGEIKQDFRRFSTITYVVNDLSHGPATYAKLIGHITCETDFAFAIVNSAASHSVLRPLREAGVPTVTLIHEFASYLAGKSTFSEIMRWSDEVVFSTDLTMHDALESNVLDVTPRLHVIPQGKCTVPGRAGSEEATDIERTRLRTVLGNDRAGERRFIVLGAGKVEYRKGVDLFIEVANRILRSSAGTKFAFAWVGAGYAPDEDTGYSSFLRDQLSRAGIADRVLMLPATSQIEAAYELADVLVLSSRLDPLPNVAVDALCRGLPVVCFDQTSGIADLLGDAGLTEDCVAIYLDTHDMADKLHRFLASPERLATVSSRSREFAAEVFDLDRYVRRLEVLGHNARSRADNRSADIADIVTAGCFRPDFFDSSASHTSVTAAIVRDYLERLTWTTGARKPEPGFNPYIYAEDAKSGYDGRGDPYADFLRKGRPDGTWSPALLEGGPLLAQGVPAPSLSSALHIHAYFSDQLQEIVARLHVNRARPDLFVSVGQQSAIEEARSILADYDGHVESVEAVVNAGRDIGPLLTLFGANLTSAYDVVGHVHIKKSPHVDNPDFVAAWSNFLFENVLGGSLGGGMVDQILSYMSNHKKIGIVYPDDPHLCGWTQNLAIAEKLARRMGHDALPHSINFPVGTMFWMRSAALKSFVGLGLDWPDYPREPLPIDGTMVHALERLFGVVPLLEGWSIAVTNIRGLTR